MRKEIITDKQGVSLMTLFIMGSTLILGTGAEAGKDAWISVVIAAAYACPAMLIYCRLLTLFPGQGVYDISELVLGKLIGKGVNLLYIWFSFHLGALVLRNFGEFIITVSLPETPIIITMIGLIFICFWISKEGIEVLGRWGELGLIIMLLFGLLGFGLLIPQMKIQNIQPVLQKGIKPVLKGGFGIFAFPFAETVVLLGLFGALKREQSVYRTYFMGLLLGAIAVFLSSITEIMVIGEGEYGASFFPAHVAVARINIRNFIQRLEIMPAIIFVGGGFVKISLCLLNTSVGIAKTLGYKDYRFAVAPISLLMLNLAYLIYDSVVEMFEWAFSTWPYYAFSFQVILPVILWIGAEIKIRRRKGVEGSHGR